MKRITVVSSNISSVGYDLQGRILEIEFLNGSIYRYFHVSEGVYRGLMSAPSHGQYFDTYIKNGGYSYTRVL